MSLTLTTADEALKEFYLPAVREQLNQEHLLLNQIETNTEDVEGRRAVLSLHVRRSAGVGARAEGGTLPTAGNQQYAEERVPLRYNYGRIKVSGPVIKAMKSDRGSFVRAVESEMTGITNDLKRDVNRQLFGTSDGVIARTGVTSASTTVVLGTNTTVVQLGQLEEGMLIDIGTVANPTSVASAREVESVDETAKTIVISGAAVTTATTDRIFRSGSGGSGASQKELTGLQTIVDSTGTLFNVDPTTYGVWASVEDSNSGTARTASENLFTQIAHKVRRKSGLEFDLILTSDGVVRNYANQLTSLKRFPNTVDLKGGFKGLSLSTGGSKEVSIAWDRDAPNDPATGHGIAFGLNTAHLAQHASSDWEWADEDGAVLSRVSGEDAYEAFLFRYHELTTDRRNVHAKIADLSLS